ncbi:MAG: YopX family protein [Clostridia bacterium]|jgi:uncharacterized phage protein (TIGR01671 family)|nr:YopX family protein [Clostridia bacterium]
MEYKFRGQRVDNKEWIYGSLDLSNWHTGDVSDLDYKYPIIILHDKSQFLSKYVFPETVGQYTGLKDKHGKEIYSGDIVKTAPYGEIAEIKYSDHFQRLHLHFKGDYREHLKNELGIHIFDWIYPEPSLEVIGNKFDNPELLEVK